MDLSHEGVIEVPSDIAAALATQEPGLSRRQVPDGRVARGLRTKRALAEALIGLLEEGALRPTSRQIAERAGVSLRSVFQHFDDVEDLYREAFAVQTERYWSRLEHIEPELALDERIERLVNQRSELYEAITSVRLAALWAEQTSESVSRALDQSRRMLRLRTQETFSPELEVASRLVRDSLDLATSWETWVQLRRHLGCSAGSARKVMAHMIRAVLASAKLAEEDH